MENKARKRRREGRREKSGGLHPIMAFAFIGGVLLLAVASIIKPDVRFSEEENRILTEMPKLNKESLADKSYMTDLESYTSDQFIMRDFWIKMKVQGDLLLGKRELNGVYLGKEKYLMQAPSNPDEENVKANLEAMNQFAQKHENINVNAMIVPNAVYVMEDYLPSGAPVRDQSKDMKNIQKQLSEQIGFIDVTKTLQQHAEEGMYYKTDHHWTSKAALYSFKAAAEQMGIENPVSDYTKYTVSNSFSGTLASRSGYHKAEDTIEVYAPEGVEVQYLVSDSDNAEKRPTVYDKDKLKEKDKYQLFFGGNHAMVDILTTNDTTRRLVVFKDSYANCFVPYLIPYYNEIIMIDPRYYYDNVETLISNKWITDVLFMYNVDTFMTDNSIAGVLAAE